MKYLKLFEHYIPVLHEIENLKSFSKRIEFCRSKLTYLGQGYDRIVFKLNDGKVLKLVKNNRGILQNKNEYFISQNSNIVAKVYDKSYDFIWIISEYAPVIKPKDFNILGFNFTRYCLYLTNLYLKVEDESAYNHRLKFGFNGEDLSEDEIKFFENNDFTQSILKVTNEFNINRDDLIRISSYGKREISNQIILIDYGLTQNSKSSN